MDASNALPQPRSRLRRGVVILGTVGLLMGMSGVAFANAPNPLPGATAVLTTQGDGSIRVDVSGVWNWGSLSLSSPLSSCGSRYGVGWAVDWWGTGGAIPGLHGPMVSVPGPTISDGPLSPDVAIVSLAMARPFHASFFVNGYTTDLCSQQDANGFPTGSWSSYAVYPNVESIPARVCVNLYDIHGSSSTGPILNDFRSNAADSSIKVNNFNATSPAFCASTGLGPADQTPPVVVGTPDRSPNSAGWYDAPVTISWSASDDTDGVLPAPPSVTLSSEGQNRTVTSAWVCDAAGNCARGTVTGLNLDVTAPVITFVGNAGTYTVDQQVTITCAANDPLSGVAAATCPSVDVPAYSLPLGVNTLSATATDAAGNTSTAETTFTIEDTPQGMKSLITDLSSSTGVATSLGTKVDAIANAPTEAAQAGKIIAFDNQVDAQTGKALTAEEGAVLVDLADGL